MSIASVSRRAWPRLCLLDVAQLAVPAFLILSFSSTAADADLWGHLRFGADVLRGHGFTARDPYSFTSDIAWVNHEWLAEVVTALFYRLGGAVGLNALKLVVIGAVGALAWVTGRREGGRRFALVLLSGLVLVETYTRTQALRPQLFSVLLFAVLMVLLRRRELGRRQSFLTVPLLFCVWANAHGGWLVGFGTLAAWSALFVVERPTLENAARRAIELAAALGATLINPYGIRMWTFLHETVGLDRDISDWTPFIKFPPPLIALELVLPCVAVMALIRARKAPPARHAAVIATLAFATYRVGRVDAFLQVAVAFMFAPALVSFLNEAENWLRQRPRLVRPSPVHALAAGGLAAYALVAGSIHVTRIAIAGTWVPDAEAVQFIQRDPSRTRLLTWFDWGEYAIWHLSPAGIQVSMDGRRETVYSPRVLQDHWSFYRNERDGWTYADAIGADRIWIPKKFSVVSTLREHGWHVAYESAVSVVLDRTESQPPIVASLAHGPRAFPGP